MLTRIIIGTVLIAATFGMFSIDRSYLTTFPAPCLFTLSVVLAGAASYELIRMFSVTQTRYALLAIVGSILTIAFHWAKDYPGGAKYVFALFVMATLMAALVNYQASNNTLHNVAFTVFALLYLGLFAGYFVDLRLNASSATIGTACLALAVFVPKGCDMGAYFTGKAIGRTPFAPTLSPKKTWEGIIGGLVAAVIIAVCIHTYVPSVFPHGRLSAAAFGLVIGWIGVLGDLVESMMKREAGAKDAGKVLPEFGGVLDIVDSILFAAPVVYWWLKASPWAIKAG